MSRICGVEGCARPIVAKELCSTHYQRLKKRGDLRPDEPIGYRPPPKQPDICSVDGCERVAKALGYCYAHWERFRKTGDVQADRPFKTQAPNGAGTLETNGYRAVRVSGRKQKEHRLVMERLIGRKLLRTEQVHHINGDRSDNRPENLELWEHSQPSGQRIQDKLAWAYEIVARYGDSNNAAIRHNLEVT